MFRNRLIIPYCLIAFCSFIFLEGCGDSSKGTVKGKVAYQNHPVNDYDLNLVWKEKGFAVTIALGENGEFALQQALNVGTYTAYLTPKPPTQAPPGTKLKKAVVGKIPAKYTDATKSDLKVTVKTGSNDLSIELKE